MNKTTGLVIFLITILNLASANAQIGSSNSGTQPDLPSWETYELMKYGNIGASLYTGTINYSVPIYYYKDTEFEIPVSIDYATNGLRVNHKSGILGQSWQLSNQGIITRQINGIPDETEKIIGGGDVSATVLRGYKFISGNIINEGHLCQNNNEIFTCLISSGNQYFDAEPDIYTFNFCGFSGSFRRAQSVDGVNSNFLFFNESTYSRGLKIKSLDESDDIIIVDGSGYEYLFEIDEYTRVPLNDGVGAQLTNRVFSWHLSQIKAPSGRTVNFTYWHSVEDNVTTHDISYHPTLTYDFSSFLGMESLSNSSSTIEVIPHDVCISHLTGMIFPDSTKIILRYVDGENEYYHPTINGPIANAMGDNKRLSGITVKRQTTILKNVKFSYITESPNNDNGNTYTFLHDIDISGVGRYSFDYYAMSGFPALGTIKSDHWGYYNGENGGFSVNNFFNNLTYGDNYEETFNSSLRRNPDFNASLSGSLKQITYPTGGYSVITYEPHDYSAQVDRNRQSMYLPSLSGISHNEETGGIRLKQIITHMQDSSINDTTYYEYLDLTTNLSSGILINKPRYGINYNAPGASSAFKSVMHFNLMNYIYDMNRTHIEYSHVREHSSSKGYKDYYYSTYYDHSDEECVDENLDARNWTVNYWQDNSGKLKPYYFHNPDNYVTNLLTPLASRQSKRGLLLKEESHDINGSLKNRKVNAYDFPMVKVDTVYSVVGDITREVYYPRYNIELRRTDNTCFLDNGQDIITTNYIYNNYGLPSTVSSKNSKGDSIITKSYYTGDSVTTNGIVGQMRSYNIVNYLLSQYTSSVTNGNETLLYKIKYNYTQPNSSNNTLFRCQSTERWGLSNAWSTDETFSYDDIGLLTQHTDRDGRNSSMIWGYNARYPLVVAQNATFAELYQGLVNVGINSPLSLRNSSNIDDAVFNKLRKLGHFMPNALINSYKYKPATGITEIAKPNSLRGFYNYDGYGRLISIADNYNSNLEQQDYSLLTLKPLTAVIVGDNYYHINVIGNIEISANGGSGSYSYSYTILNAQGATIYQHESGSNVLTINPIALGLSVGNNYIIQCTVSDQISNEVCMVNKTVNIRNALIFFGNSNTVIDLEHGNGSLMSSIYTDSSLTVTVELDMQTSGNCSITIGNTTHNYTGRKTGYQFTVSLSSGLNNVEVVFSGSYSETSAELSIVGAGTHDIGTSNSISIEF